MGNVSDKISDDSSYHPTMDSSIPTRLEFSPAISGDQSSSLEWFDASESIAASSSPTGHVLEAVKNGSKDKADSFLKNPSFEIPVYSSPLTGLESRSSTAHFGDSPTRTLITRLNQPYELQLSRTTSSPLPPVERRHKAQAGEPEDMKSPKNVKEEHREKNGKEEVEEKKRKDSEKQYKEAEERKEEVQNLEKMEEEFQEKKEDVAMADSAPKETTKSSSTTSALPILSLNTPDVISDIPSDLLLELPATLSPFSLSSSPPNSFDDFTDTPSTSSRTDVEMKKQKKKSKKRALQVTKERQSLQRVQADKIREEKLRKERELAEAAVVKEVSKNCSHSEEQQEVEQEETNEVSVERIEVHQEETFTTSPPPTPTFTLPILSSCYSSTDFVNSTSPYFNKDNRSTRVSSEDVPAMVTQVSEDEDGSSSERDMGFIENVEDIVEEKQTKTFTVMVGGKSTQCEEFFPQSKRSFNDIDDAQLSAESSPIPSEIPVYGIAEHPPVIVPFRDAPIIATSSYLPQMNMPPPPPSFVVMPMPYQTPPPYMIKTYTPIQPRMLPPPPAQYPLNLPPGIQMRHVPMPGVMMGPSMYYPTPSQAIPMPTYAAQVPQTMPHLANHPPMRSLTPPPPHRPIVLHHYPQQQQPLVRPARQVLAITQPPIDPTPTARSPILSSNLIPATRPSISSSSRPPSAARSGTTSSLKTSSAARSSTRPSPRSSSTARSSIASPTSSSSTSRARSTTPKPDKQKEMVKKLSVMEKTKKVIAYVEKQSRKQLSSSGSSSYDGATSFSRDQSPPRSSRTSGESTSSSVETIVEPEEFSVKKVPAEESIEKTDDKPLEEPLLEPVELAVKKTENNEQVEGSKVDYLSPLIPVQEAQEHQISRHRRNSSLDINGEVISSLVAAVLIESDDELPPLQSSSSTSSILSPTMEARLADINRNLESNLPQISGNEPNSIWRNKNEEENPEKPKPSSSAVDDYFHAIFEEDKKSVGMARNGEILRNPAMVDDEDEYDKKPTLLSICRKIEPFFVSCCEKWKGAILDSEQLRGLFIEAYGGQIPRDHWLILEKVCSFQPGYFNVFDAIIGSVYDWTYKFVSTPEFKQEKETDSLYSLYQSLPPVDGLDNFFKRFEEVLLKELIQFVSNRYVSVRTFIAIAEIVSDLSTSDIYYLATLVFGSRQFMAKFNTRIKQLHVMENGGKRWIRQVMMDPLQIKSSFAPGNDTRMKTVADFLTRLRPHIDDILQVLPDSVVTDGEFFKIAKMVCGWSGDDEERIWKSITKDRVKFQQFHEAYRPFLRIEIRMETIFLRKLTYDDDDDYEEPDVVPMRVISNEVNVNLISSIKSEDVNRKEKKKGVSYAAEVELISPDAPPEPTGRNRSSQTDHLDIGGMWNLEREVLRLLKRDDIPFAEFIQTENAREMQQFLIDQFKERDLNLFASILEKTLIDTREEAWKDTLALRDAAEEAQLLLELAREQHRKEFGELRSRMETISRFEAYEVEVASNSRIEGLKERIKQLTQDRDVLLREEVKEERARVERQMRELKEKHAHEKRILFAEISRLKDDNSRLSTRCQELEIRCAEQEETTARCENRMIQAKDMCASSTKVLIESQKEIETLREAALDRQSLPNTPESQPEFEPAPENLPSTSTSSPYPESPILTAPLSPLFIELSSEARRQLRIMEKYAAEFDLEELRDFGRELLDAYNNSKANHKERKTAEKQFKDFEVHLEGIKNAIQENIQMIKLNVVDGLLPLCEIQNPFSDTVMKKMLEYNEMDIVSTGRAESIPEEEDVCLICTDPVEEMCECIKCHTCFKEYHYHCISQWLKINSVCPACSRALKDPNEYPMLE